MDLEDANITFGNGAATLAGLGLGGLGAGAAGKQLWDLGLAKHNPWGDVKGIILGGTASSPGGTGIKGGTSFGNQALALAEGLKANGLDIDTHAFYNPAWGPIEHKLDPGKAMKYDFAVQVGNNPIDGTGKMLGEKQKAGDLLRYRLLTDFNNGNFRQPEMQFGNRNGMAVEEAFGHASEKEMHRALHKAYERFLVPGQMEKTISDKASMPFEGRMPGNIYLNNIPIAEKPFAENKWMKEKGLSEQQLQKILHPELSADELAKFSDRVRPHVWMESGGGSGLGMLFSDRQGQINKGIYNASQGDTVIDDILRAAKAQYGDDVVVHLGVGNALKAGDGDYRKQMLQQVLDRYKGDDHLRTIGFIDQDKLAKLRGRANAIFQMPGSSTAEELRMALEDGAKLPTFVNLYPHTDVGDVAHFATNADHFNKHTGSHSYEMWKGMGDDVALDKDRASKFVEMLRKGNVLPEGEKPNVGILNNYDEVAKALKADAIGRRWKNLSRLAGKGGLAGAGAALAGLGLYNMFKKED